MAGIPPETPTGFFGRLFSTFVSYIMRGLGIQAAEERFIGLYGTVGETNFAAAEALAQQAVGNVERLLQLPPGAPLSTALGGAPEPNPTVWVRTVQHFTNAQGQDMYRTIDIEVPWSFSAAYVYADAAQHARDIADTYNWTLVDVSIIPPLLF